MKAIRKTVGRVSHVCFCFCFAFTFGLTVFVVVFAAVVAGGGGGGAVVVNLVAGVRNKYVSGDAKESTLGIGSGRPTHRRNQSRIILTRALSNAVSCPSFRSVPLRQTLLNLEFGRVVGRRGMGRPAKLIVYSRI